MRSEFSELLTDLKEQMLYLQELGVENVAVDLPVFDDSKLQISDLKSTATAAETRIPRERLEKFVPDLTALKSPAEKPQSEAKESKTRRSSLLESTKLSRLASLPKIDSPVTPDPEPRENLTMPKQKPVEPEDLTASLFGDISNALPESEETVEEIRADIGNCTRCPLHEGRTKIVHSTGNLKADLMFIGEAPGADEDAKGEPFVGRAGQLLNKIIEAIGMKREDVFIGNINRCRPPGNRAPTLPEAETCKPFLLREIAVVRPKVIVVLGNTATQNLLNTKTGITKLRGEFQDYYGVKVMPTFHPAYLLRDPSKKRETWEDMKIVRDYLNKLK